MDEIITPADIRALRNDLVAPTQTFIRVLSASQDRDIQQELLKKHIYSVTLTNGVYTFAKTEHKVSTLTKNIITRLLYRIVMFYIDNGTSSKMQTSSRYIMFVQTDATTGSSAKPAVLGAILVSDLQAAIKTVTVHTRRWMRRYADVAFDLLETYFPSHTPALMTKWAFAPEDRSVAFDFADGITTSKLTARQVAAISASKGANFARDAASSQQTINLSYTYHQGMLGSMTPARRLLPQAPP